MYLSQRNKNNTLILKILFGKLYFTLTSSCVGDGKISKSGSKSIVYGCPELSQDLVLKMKGGCEMCIAGNNEL